MRSFKRARGNRVRDIPEDIPEEKPEPDSLKAQLNSIFMEEFDRNQYNAFDGVAGGMWTNEPLADKPEDKTHFYGFNYSPEELNLNSEWSVTTQEQTDEPNINANEATSSVTITTTDHTSSYSGDKIYIGDPPQQEVQTFDNFGNLIDPNWVNQPDHQMLQPNTITTSGSFNFGVNKNEKYAVVELDREDVPMAVYISGRMLTLGILGTDVECAFTGDKLVFEPGVVSAISFGNRITMIIEYDDEIRHYNIGESSVITYESEKSSTLVVNPVSTIVKKKGSSLSGAK